jgi:phenylacetate-CoA ligase
LALAFVSISWQIKSAMSAPQGISGGQVFQFLMQSQHWTPEQMRAFQQNELGSLLRHARATVPFYKTRLDAIFKTDGSIDWSQWHKLPIVKRADVAANYEVMQSSKLPLGHGPTGTLSTSGSTGHPIKVTFTKLIGDIGFTMGWRAQRWWNFDWSAVRVNWNGDLPADWEAKSRIGRGPWGCVEDEKAQQGQWYEYDRGAPLDAQLQHLRDVNAKYLSAQSNFPYAAALEMLRSDRRAKIDALFLFSASIEPEYYGAVKDAFGAEIRGMYSSKEAGSIGYTCSTGQHYHVCAENILVEILDDDDRPCPPGQTGRVIVTPFYNTAQPFIRYDQGDMASWGEPCSCGITLPVIDKINGRIYHLFKRPDGERFAPQVLDHLRKNLGAEIWQFAQTGVNQIEVRYKPIGRRDKQREESFSAELQREFGHRFEISYKIVKNLPLTRSGKFIKYVNETSSD